MSGIKNLLILALTGASLLPALASAGRDFHRGAGSAHRQNRR